MHISNKTNKAVISIDNKDLSLRPGMFIRVRIILGERKNAQVVPPSTDKVSSSSGVAIPGWSKIIMPANTKTIKVDFFNPEENKDLYYLTFELRLLDSSEKGYETLYTSDLVSPGLHIQEITLSRELSVGEYDGIIHVQPYRMDVNKTATNMADLKTKIIVK